MQEDRSKDADAFPYRELNDEIDLTDLVLAIWRRRRIFLGVFLVVFALSVAYAFLAISKYEYHTTLEIGHVSNGLELDPIEEADTLKERLQRNYVPGVIYAARGDNIGAMDSESVEVSVPEEAGVIELSRRGPAGDEKQNLELLTRLIERVKAKHDQIFDLASASWAENLTKASNELQSLKTKESLIQADLDRTKQKAALLKGNIDDLRSEIDNASAQRQDVMKSASADQKAMTLLLIDNQLQSDRRRLEELQEQLQVGLERERDQLQGQLSDNQRAQDNQQKEIATLEARAKAMDRTHTLIPPTMSKDPVSPDRPLILLLGILIAGLLALVAVGIAALVESVANKQASIQSA